MKWIKRLLARRQARRMLRRNFDYPKFKQRLKLMPADDPLWPLLLALLDAHVLKESESVSVSNLASSEAHRGCGRISMLHDLRVELENSWRDAREQPMDGKP